MSQIRGNETVVAGEKESLQIANCKLQILCLAPIWMRQFAISAAVVLNVGLAWGQLPELRQGSAVPHEVRDIYDRGLQYLANSQTAGGDWQNTGQQGPGVTGLCLMTLLASGEDPNFGPYSAHVRAALRSIIQSQDTASGCIGPGNMYHHGFAMLGLAEAYGAVDDHNLWSAAPARRAVSANVGGGGGRSVGQALELAVRCALASQKQNPFGGWRYSPNARDADTSVSGAVLVGLLAARNAGIEVPDQAIDRALAYYRQSTGGDGSVGYSGGMGGGPGDSLARSSIATLVYAVARRKDLKEYKATLEYLKNERGQGRNHNDEYTFYYQAQALYQGDPDAWEKWNKAQIRRLKDTQQADGSFASPFGQAYGTSMSLLVLAVNYRFLPIYER
ncbi:MAG TPA: squalene--hopene cyclase [Pirellulales bacterium]|nr:squalene--hopene cyclase [Pirellulales bacterium]